MLFQSLGSNYHPKQVWKHLFAKGSDTSKEELRSELTKQFVGKETVLFHTGRAALSQAVKLLTGGKGAVVVNAFTCSVVVDAVRKAGCRIVYADVDPSTLHFSANTLEAKLQADKDIKAVIIQNSLGIPVDIVAFEKVIASFGISLIEDVAHAIGGEYDDGRTVGSVGEMTMVSFGRDKMLDVVNGGALVIRSQGMSGAWQPNELPKLLTTVRDRFYPLFATISRWLFPVRLGGMMIWLIYRLGLAVRTADETISTSQTMTKWQAKLGLSQVQQIKQSVSRRQTVASWYQDLESFMPKVPTSSAVRVPLLLANRNEVVAKLKQHGFFFEDIWYDVPVAPARLYDQQQFPEGDNPVATEITKHIMNLPTHGYVTEEKARQIVTIIKEVAKPWK